MTPTRIDEWHAVYSKKFAEAVKRHPSQYPIKRPVTEISADMRLKVESGQLRSININVIGWKSTAKHFGIANTYTEWTKWFNEE